MNRTHRQLYNSAVASSDQVFTRYKNELINRVGDIPFRLAETPLFLSAQLRDLLARQSTEIVAQLSEPATLAKLKQAIPARYDMPGMDALPNCMQVDFGLVKGKDGELEGRVIELQAFPSLYALMSLKSDAWATAMEGHAGLEGPWSCFIHQTRDQAMDLMRRTLLGGNQPEDVVLVDIEPNEQKTRPDFIATEKLFGVESVCVTDIIKEGRQLFRMRNGVKTRIKRIYNRMVFDELEVKNVKVPFAWTDDLDVTWCCHPNWYWTWSKFALPSLNHPAVPKTTYLSELKELPADLSRYVLKPLFSFAGTGVKVDVSREDVDAVPADQRHNWVLQEKVEYAPAVTMPDGTGVKAEIRVMLLRPPEEKTLTPLICLVRLSRGKMIGVDHNKDMPWTGGSVGMWPEK